MSTDIPKTQTAESRALENAMSGKVHNIKSPDPLWVTVQVVGGKAYGFDLHDASMALMVQNIIRDNEKVIITHRKDWQ